MFTIRHALAADAPFWFALDSHLSRAEFAKKIRDEQGYIIGDGDKAVGVMRYNLFWDSIPFLTFIYLEEAQRGKGFGRQAVLFWEAEMKRAGYEMVMTSTQVDEEAQHFYRRLGYKDRGSLFLDDTPFPQPQELLMLKVIAGAEG